MFSTIIHLTFFDPFIIRTLLFRPSFSHFFPPTFLSFLSWGIYCSTFPYFLLNSFFLFHFTESQNLSGRLYFLHFKCKKISISPIFVLLKHWNKTFLIILQMKDFPMNQSWNSNAKQALRRVYTSSFRMRFPHCVAIFYNLPWLSKTKISNNKLQRNAVNTCGNRMCKLSLKVSEIKECVVTISISQ